jgi:hypothetical protein
VGEVIRTLVGRTVGVEALLLMFVWVLGRMMILATSKPTTRRIGKITQSVSSLFKFFMAESSLTIANYERGVK